MKKKIIGILVCTLLVATAFSTTGTKVSINTTKKEATNSLMHTPYIQLSNAGGNVLISVDSPYDDLIPTSTMDWSGRLIVAYVHEIDVVTSSIDLWYSMDNGKTWTIAESFLPDGKIADCPSITNIPTTHDVALSYLEPINSDVVPLHSWRISNVTDDKTYDDIIFDFPGTEKFTAVANGYVADMFIQFGICHITWFEFDISRCPNILYLDPNWSLPQPPTPWCYFDAQRILKTAPASNPAMTTGSERIYIVMQHDNETTGRSEIVYKATVTDLDLLSTPGGGPLGLDKYADIECWPWQMYLAYDAEDPDVAASGSNVCVVYTQNGDVKCSYSSDNGETWNTSVVSVDSGFPSVFMSGEHVYCAYVQNGNVYKIESEDGGATWGTPVKLNDVDGTVSEEYGSVDVFDCGVVWVDTRNGNKDIYFDTLNQPPNTPTITGPSSGKINEEHNYSFVSTDADGDEISYYIEWGDGLYTGWTRTLPSGEPLNASHIWEQRGTYSIRVKARDENGAESDWAALEVSMPKNKIINPFELFLENHPHLFPILRYLLELY